MVLTNLQPEYRATSDCSVTAIFGDRIEEAVNAAVIGLFRAVREAAPAWLENLHPAYTTLQIDFDPGQVAHDEVVSFARGLAASSAAEVGKTITIPVVYDGEDLAEVAAFHGLSPDRVVALHTAPEYRVAFLGFAPGFAYLMGLAKELETPRLATPRKLVPAGSVAIGGAQTGIYPAASPGGWRIIGQASLKLSPEWAEPGDRVRFVAV